MKSNVKIYTAENIITLYPEQPSAKAVDQAKKADQMVQSGEELGLLHGVPLTIKNNVDLKGQPNSNGAKALELITALEPSFSINALGLPSAAVPIALDQGLPHGVQIIGQRFREDTCLDAAEKIEQRVGILSHQLWDRA